MSDNKRATNLSVLDDPVDLRARVEEIAEIVNHNSDIAELRFEKIKRYTEVSFEHIDALHQQVKTLRDRLDSLTTMVLTQGQFSTGVRKTINKKRRRL